MLTISSLFGKDAPGSPVNSTVVVLLPSVVLTTTLAFWFLATYLYITSIGFSVRVPEELFGKSVLTNLYTIPFSVNSSSGVTE